MSATDEELHWADAKGVDHVTWGMIDFSVALVLFLWIKYVPLSRSVLIDTYIGYGGRYGLARGTSADAPHSSHTRTDWSYASLRSSHTEAPPPAPAESIPMDGYRKPAPASAPEPEHHVLFDEEDPFENEP